MGPESRKASSSNEGFFQTFPSVKNQFYDDISFQRVFKLFLSKTVADFVAPDLALFGQEVLSNRVLDWVTDAERNVPYLKGGGRDAFGRRTSELVVTEGWKRLQNFGIERGIVAAGYEAKYGEYARVAQFLKDHLWTGSNANVACPSAMTDGAAKLLKNHLSSNDLDPTLRSNIQDAYNRLTSRDSGYAWTSGQWMTERSGGSDVSGTETIATYSPQTERSSGDASPLGPWNIDGFKWFSSATDSSMSILLAQTPKGLSTFFAPMRRARQGPVEDPSQPTTELNGIYIQRLKNKSGTKSLPTAELELSGMRAHLIGKEGHGIYEISTILDITRLYSAVGAVGYVGRGLGIAKAFAKVREVGAGKGKRVLLRNSALHMSTLARVTVEYHSMMLLSFFVSSILGLSEHGKSSGGQMSAFGLQPGRLEDVPLLLRILTPIMKASVCKRSIHALQECMEALGGVGYLDNSESESINIARLYRDCCVNSIWEGTTDVLSSDTLRVLKGRNGDEVLAALDRWINKALESQGTALHHERTGLSGSWATLRDSILSTSSEDLLPRARDLTFDIANIVMGSLLIVDSENDMDPAAIEICSRFLEGKGITKPSSGNWPLSAKQLLALNQSIVYGNNGLTESAKL